MYILNENNDIMFIDVFVSENFVLNDMYYDYYYHIVL